MAEDSFPQPKPANTETDDERSERLLAAGDGFALSQGLDNSTLVVLRSGREGEEPYFETGWKLGDITATTDELGNKTYTAHVVKTEGDERGAFKSISLDALHEIQAVAGSGKQEALLTAGETEESDNLAEVGQEISKQDWASFTESLKDTIFEAETTVEPSTEQEEFLKEILISGSSVVIDLIATHGTTASKVSDGLDSLARAAGDLRMAYGLDRLGNAIDNYTADKSNENFSRLMESVVSAATGRQFEVSLALTGTASAIVNILRIASDEGPKPIKMTNYANSKLHAVVQAQHAATSGEA